MKIVLRVGGRLGWGLGEEGPWGEEEQSRGGGGGGEAGKAAAREALVG